MSTYLLVGLGNPGNEYVGTRHNIGFMAAGIFAKRNMIPITSKKFHGMFGTGFVSRSKVHILLPQTFMNLSGKSVMAASQFFDLDFDHIIVAHDDIDIKFGKVKIKVGGGHGGHNGLRDILSKSGKKEFIRLRLGVGRPEHGDVVNHVLGKFKKVEVDEVAEMLHLANDVLELIVEQGPEEAQNKFNNN